MIGPAGGRPADRATAGAPGARARAASALLAILVAAACALPSERPPAAVQAATGASLASATAVPAAPGDPVAPDPAAPDPFTGARHVMVERQIRSRGIADPAVLRAMAEVPRHRFVPSEMTASAYADRPLPIGHGQTISQPYIVALMTELLDLEPGDRVLEIGTGSGYHAAVVSRIAGVVFTVEIVEPLAERARVILAELGYGNTRVRAGDGYRGWPEEAPFDAVLLTAAPPEIPAPLIDQLAVGGTLVAPVGVERQELTVIRRTPTGLVTERITPVRFVPMTGEALRGEPG